MRFLRSKTFLVLIALVLVDFTVIWIWVVNDEPSPDSAIEIYIVVPFVFLLNLIIAGILFLFKKKYSSIFLVNSILSSIIMYNLFGYGIHKTIDNMYDSWEFTKNDTVFVINKSNEYNEFSMSYRTDPGSSTQFISGASKLQGDTLVLSSGSTHMFIVKDSLYNFQAVKSSIKLKIRN